MWIWEWQKRLMKYIIIWIQNIDYGKEGLGLLKYEYWEERIKWIDRVSKAVLIKIKEKLKRLNVQSEAGRKTGWDILWKWEKTEY